MLLVIGFQSSVFSIYSIILGFTQLALFFGAHAGTPLQWYAQVRNF